MRLMAAQTHNARIFTPRALFGAAVVALGVVVAIFRRFVQDDAFISFRYAKNLSDGVGLVWNVGERVEGYTNFLWTVLMAPSFKIGVDVVVWSWMLSIACFSAVLMMILSWRGASAFVRFAAAGLVVANYSLTSYATGGLETQLVTATVMASAWFLSAERPFPAAAASAMALMTRMDAVLLLIPFWLRSMFPEGLRGGLRGMRPRPLLAACGFAGVPVVVWLLWRHAYYGAWVPNTFLVKGGASPLRGVMYVSLFFLIYGWFVPPLFEALSRERSSSICGVVRRSPAMVLAVALHLAYVALVGGDFMEFRMIVPCAPFVALLLAEMLSRRRWLLCVLLALGPAGAPLLLPSRPITSVDALNGMAMDWTSDARALDAILGEKGRDVRIALTPAGIIPFYTGLRALDELGLNSRDVALRGERIRPLHRLFGNLPGHCIKATWEQIRNAGVNLVIDHPWVVERTVEDVLPLDEKGRAKRDAFNSMHPLIHVDIPPSSGARIVAWPVGGSRWWIMVLAEPCQAVDEAIQRTGAKVFALDS